MVSLNILEGISTQQTNMAALGGQGLVAVDRAYGAYTSWAAMNNDYSGRAGNAA